MKLLVCADAVLRREDKYCQWHRGWESQLLHTLAELFVSNSAAQSLVELEQSGASLIRLTGVTDCNALYGALKAEETRIRSQLLVMSLLQSE